jgi:hypothetical protein
MNGFVCCACEHRFPEVAALQTQVKAACARSTPTRRWPSTRTFEACRAMPCSTISRPEDERDQELRDAGRGHLVLP